jgi:hypothetical protein
VSIRSVIGVVAVLTMGVSACGGSSGDEALIDDAATQHTDVPDLAEALATDVDDQRGDVRAVLGGPDAFRVAIVPVDDGVVRHETWDYLDLATRIDFVDGQIVLTAELEAIDDGAWYPLHVDPSDFEAGMTRADVRARLDGVELHDLDLSEVVDPGGTALVGGQLFVTFSDDSLVTAQSFPLVPDPDGLQAQLVAAVTP